MKRSMFTIVLSVVAALLCCSLELRADVLYNSIGSTYTQNFDTLATTTGTGTIPWANDSTITGWNLFQFNNTPITTYLSHNGGVNNGSFYGFGVTGDTDRALGGAASGGAYFGSPASGAVAGYIAVSLTNGTGSTLSQATISFDGEQWRNGGNTSAQSMVFEYGLGSSFSTVGSWNSPGGSFDWTSPVTGATAAAVVGNTAGLQSNRGGTLTNLNWTAGSRLWLRWIERNDTGNDHGLAIDNFSITAVPEPGAGVLLGLTLFSSMVWRRRNLTK